MATLSRGGFFGLASAGAYCSYRSPKKVNGLIVIAVAVLFMMLLAPERSGMRSVLQPVTNNGNRYGGRATLYLGIGDGYVLSIPIIGIGQSNFPWTFQFMRLGTFLVVHRRQAGPFRVGNLDFRIRFVGTIVIGLMLLQSYKDLKLVRVRLTPVRPLGMGSRQEKKRHASLSRSSHGREFNCIYREWNIYLHPVVSESMDHDSVCRDSSKYF